MLRTQSGRSNLPTPRSCPAQPTMMGYATIIRNSHSSCSSSRYFQVYPILQFASASDVSSSGRQGPIQVVGSSGFIRSGAPTHLRWRARLISSGSSTPFLIRYPWRLKKLISWADNRFIVTNGASVGERLKEYKNQTARQQEFNRFGWRWH